MTEDLYLRNALCIPCCSELCIFAREEECRLPLVTGCLPVITEEDGCKACVPYDCAWPYWGDGIQQAEIKPGVQESVSERVAFLWSCIAKSLQSAPEESPIWSVNETRIHCKKGAVNVAAFFNAIAGREILKADGVSACLIPRNVDRRREPEEKGPEDIWGELCELAVFAKKRYDVSVDAILQEKIPVWSNGDMFFVNSEAMADDVADFFDALGFTCTTGYLDPKDDEEAGEVCESTGYWYVDI